MKYERTVALLEQRREALTSEKSMDGLPQLKAEHMAAMKRAAELTDRIAKTKAEVADLDASLSLLKAGEDA